MTPQEIAAIDEAFENPAGKAEAVRPLIEKALRALDRGEIRVSEKKNGAWTTHQWMKKALLLFFRLSKMETVEGGPQGGLWWDKIPSKFASWKKQDFEKAAFRVVPGAWVRYSAHIAQGAVLMPSFVNVGAHIGEGTMVDTWSTVGSCAQIGRNVHISGGVGIGGVLEPIQANPVIVEDGCFIGARSEVAEGVIVREGSVLAMGVFLSASTKIIDRQTGEMFQGEVPPFSVVVSGTLAAKPLPDGSPAPNLYCAVIVKRVDAQTRSKTSINALLRESEKPS